MKHATLRHLLTFEAVARQLNYSRAARELGVTQPTASTHVRQLEESLGVALFMQLGKRVILTEAGRTMLRHAYTIIDAFQTAQESMAKQVGVADAVCIGIDIDIATHFQAVALAFEKRHAHVPVVIESFERAALVAAIRDGSCDLGILTGTIAEPDLRIDTFAELRAASTSDRRFWHLAHCGDNPLSGAAQQFRRFLIEYGGAVIQGSSEPRTPVSIVVQPCT